MSLFGLGKTAEIEIVFDDEDSRKAIEMKVDKDQKARFPLYFDGETVRGQVLLRVRDGKRIEHQGVRIQFIGHIELLFGNRDNHDEFLTLSQSLVDPGVLDATATYDFAFHNVEKRYESYFGNNVKLRYFVRVVMGRRMSNVVKERDVWVHSYRMPPDINNAIKMEVGIEDCFTPDHDVLTERGFRPFHTITHDDRIAAVVPSRAADGTGPPTIHYVPPVPQADGRAFLEKPLDPTRHVIAVADPQIPGGVALTTTETHDWYTSSSSSSSSSSSTPATDAWTKAKIGALYHQRQPFRVMGGVAGGLAPRPTERAVWLALCADADCATPSRADALLRLYGYYCAGAAMPPAAAPAGAVALPIPTAPAAALIQAWLAEAGQTVSVTVDDGHRHAVIAHTGWSRIFGFQAALPKPPADADGLDGTERGADDEAVSIKSLDDAAASPRTIPVLPSPATLAEGATSDRTPAGTTVVPLVATLKLAAWVFNALTRSELRAVIQGLHAAAAVGAGVPLPGPLPALVTPSPHVRDTLSHLYLVAGYASRSHVVSLSIPAMSDGPSWLITCHDPLTNATDATSSMPVVQPEHCRRVAAPATGVSHVYCVTVPSGLLIVRKRQGHAVSQPVVCGNCLHLEFEYNKSKYHLRDVIFGKIYFLLVRIKIKYMELSINRRETTGTPPNEYNESDILTRFEIMDGAPMRGESIPIRLFLSGFELTPTYRNVNKKFSTRYYLNLVLVDDENRRYYKQQEVTIYRLPEEDALPAALPTQNLGKTRRIAPPALSDTATIRHRVSTTTTTSRPSEDTAVAAPVTAPAAAGSTAAAAPAPVRSQATTAAAAHDDPPAHAAAAAATTAAFQDPEANDADASAGDSAPSAEAPHSATTPYLPSAFDGAPDPALEWASAKP